MSDPSSLYLYIHIFREQIEVCIHVSTAMGCVHSCVSNRLRFIPFLRS